MIKLLRNRLFVKMSLADLISALGDSLFYIALLTYASTFENKALAIFLVSLSESIPSLFFFITGILADRTVHRVNRILWSNILRAVIYVGVGIVIGLSKSYLVLLSIVLLNLVSDLAGKYSESLYTPLFPMVVTDDQIEQASGVNSAVIQSTAIVANFLGAIMLLHFSYFILALINAMTFLLSWTLVYSAKTELKKLSRNLQLEHVDHPSFRTELGHSLQSIQETHLVGPITFFSGLNLVLAPLVTLFAMQLSYDSTLRLATYPLTLAIFNGSVAVGLIIGNMFGTQLFKKVSYELMTFLCAGLLFLVYGSLVLRNVYVIVLVAFLTNFVVGAIEPKFSALIIRQTPTNKLGSISGAVNTVLFLATSVSLLGFPAIANFLKLTTVYFILLTVAAIIALISLGYFLKNRSSGNSI